MKNRTYFWLHDPRRSLRIREHIPILWHVQDPPLKGRGRIVNISTSGMMIEASGDIPSQNPSLFQIQCLNPKFKDNLPTSGRMVWSKKRSFPPHTFLCGIEFVEPSPNVIQTLRERIQQAIVRMAQKRRIQSLVQGVLIVMVIGVCVYLFRVYTQMEQTLQDTQTKLLSALDSQVQMQRIYKKRFKEQKAQLTAAQTQIQEKEEELSLSRQQLAAFETQLAKAQEENQNLNMEIKRLIEENLTAQEMNLQFDQTIQELRETNQRFSEEMALLKERLRYFEGDIQRLEEGKEMIGLYRQKMRLVKKQMHMIKHEMHLSRIAAFKEQDRLRLLQGNNGYLVRDGRPVPRVDFHVTPPPKTEIEIDVTFFK